MYYKEPLSKIWYTDQTWTPINTFGTIENADSVWPHCTSVWMGSNTARREKADTEAQEWIKANGFDILIFDPYTGMGFWR